MNKDRRKAIGALIDAAQAIAGQITDLKDQIEAIRDEEQDYFDNMPESLQGGEKGEAAEAAISALETAVDALDAFDVDEVVGALDEATAA